MAGDDRDGLNCQLVLDPNWRTIAIAKVNSAAVFEKESS
jgi:hypothetical protein